MSLDRPVTSKPRGICRYYNKAPRSCLAGHSCKFLHGEAEKLTPFDKSKVCKYYAAGFCRRGAGCWFLHQDPVPSASTQQDGSLQERSLEEEDNFCCICYDKPVTYGLLDGCGHIFCVKCIREWRDPDGKTNDIVSSGNTKRCPFCRVKSRFVTPSSHFYPEGHPGKLAIIEQYKASMARVPCRYFQKSPSSKRFCPFGKDCFYQHQNEDGTPYVFTLGVDHYMEIHQRRPRRGWIDLNELESLSDFGPSAQLDLDDLDSIRLRLPMLFESMSLYDDFSPSNGQWQDSPNIADDASEGNATSLQTVLRMADRLIEDITDHVGERSQTFYHFGAADLIEGGSGASAQLPETTESIAGDVLVPSESVSSDSTASSTSRGLPSSAGGIPPRFSTIVPGHERLIADDVSPGNELDLMRSLPDGPDVSSIVSDAILASGTRGTPSGAAEARSLADDAFSHEAEMVMQETDALNRRVDEVLATQSSLTLSPPPTSLSTDEAQQDDNTHVLPESAALHDVDPPFLTDGRGRVVWSSATAPRREGRWSRAATLTAQQKGQEVADGEGAAPRACDGPSPGGRQRSRQVHCAHSLPEIADGTDLELSGGFFTDGRGRVISTGGAAALPSTDVLQGGLQAVADEHVLTEGEREEEDSDGSPDGSEDEEDLVADPADTHGRFFPGRIFGATSAL